MQTDVDHIENSSSLLPYFNITQYFHQIFYSKLSTQRDKNKVVT